MNIFGWFYLFEKYPQAKVRDIPGHAIIQAKRIGAERAALAKLKKEKRNATTH